MLILKLDNIILASTSTTQSDNANFANSAYKDRQIIALGKTDFKIDGSNSNLKWKIKPNKQDSDGKPAKELDGSIIFNIDYIGVTTSQYLGLKDRKLYLRIKNASAILGKSFLTIIEDSVDNQKGLSTVEFLTDLALSTTTLETFEMSDVFNDIESKTPFDITNRSFFINKQFRQYNVIVFYLHTVLGGDGSLPTTFRTKYNYLTLPPNTGVNTVIANNNKPNELNPTFQDFLSVYQQMLYSDPSVLIAAVQDQINSEKEKMKKYESVLSEFNKYMSEYNNRLKNHNDILSKIPN